MACLGACVGCKRLWRLGRAIARRRAPSEDDHETINHLLRLLPQAHPLSPANVMSRDPYPPDGFTAYI